MSMLMAVAPLNPVRVEPVHVGVIVIRSLGQHCIAVLPAGAVAVNDVAKQARGALYVRRSRDALRLIGAKRLVNVSVAARHRLSQTLAILQRLAGALRDILEHWMRRVADQRDVVPRPVVVWGAVVHRPVAIPFDPGQRPAYALVGLGEMLLQLRLGAPVLQVQLRTVA